jgi:hypothetical protein
MAVNSAAAPPKNKTDLGHPVAYKHAIPPGWAAGQRPPMIFLPSLTQYDARLIRD